jgi:hypothetical protein
MLIVLFWAGWGTAQVEVSFTLPADTFRVGKDIDLEIVLKPESDLFPSSAELQVFDSLGLVKYLFPEDSTLQSQDIQPVDFEISDYGKWIATGTAVMGDGVQVFPAEPGGEIRNRVKLRIWDPGNFLLLIGEITLQLSDGNSRTYYPDIRHARVVYISGPADLQDGEVEIRPIKDIIREGWHWLDFKWLYMAVLVLALILFLLNRPFRRKKRAIRKEEKKLIVRPAHEIALERLQSLRKEALWQRGDVKGFQTALSHIVREYLENRFAIRALESTTGEIIRDLGTQALDDSDREVLRDLLSIADLVKFARAKPDEDIHEQFLDRAVAFVEKTRKQEENTNQNP